MREAVAPVLPTRDVWVEGVRSAVYEAGPRASTEAAVFVHGNPGPLDDWEHIAPSVAAICRVVAPDLPGFGRADHPRRFDFSIGGYARHLGGILRQLEVERAHLVLHDFGGPWGLAWAAEHPEQVASVTLINSVLLSADYRWHFAAKLWSAPVISLLLQLLARPSVIAWAMNRDNPRPFPEPFIARIMRHLDWNQRMAVNALYRSSRDVAKTLAPLGERVRTLNVPACVIWGAEDRYTPVRYAAAQRAVFPRAEVHTIEGAGHWPFVDEPQRVRALVCSFLQRQMASAGAA